MALICEYYRHVDRGFEKELSERLKAIWARLLGSFGVRPFIAAFNFAAERPFLMHALCPCRLGFQPVVSGQVENLSYGGIGGGSDAGFSLVVHVISFSRKARPGTWCLRSLNRFF
jgi:hypothetical protein